MKWWNKVFYIEYNILCSVKAVLSIDTIFLLKGGTSFQENHIFKEKISFLWKDTAMALLHIAGMFPMKSSLFR